MIDFQFAFNLLLGAFSALAGWMLSNLTQSMRDLTRADAELTGKVNQIELLVAGNYIRRSEFESKIDAVFTKLDKIEEKLDHRVEGYRSQQ
jgi:hypothetical protein